MTHQIAVIKGDGVGPEVIDSALRITSNLNSPLRFEEVEAGDEVARKTGTPLPAETLRVALESDAVLLGAIGSTAAKVVIRLRDELDTYVNLRPVKSFPGVETPYPGVDFTVVRENTEGLYVGIENKLTPEVTTATRVITEGASKRIAEFAFEYARKRDAAAVTAIHKSNVLPITDGRFLQSVREVAGNYQVNLEEMLVDAAALHMVKSPESFEVVLTPNLFGDILSDLGGGLVGGLGLCPSANLGDQTGLFEPVHGTAPDIAGENRANPVAAVLSAAYMLKFLGEEDNA
ncbi:MAG: isocitrate/isopropylmalate dehydrogenase family protein, partial [Candidatus Bipolaricaulota bacterium]